MTVSNLIKEYTPDTTKKRANYIYYFEVGVGGQDGAGLWEESFQFKVTDWDKFWNELCL